MAEEKKTPEEILEEQVAEAVAEEAKEEAEERAEGAADEAKGTAEKADEAAEAKAKDAQGDNAEGSAEASENAKADSNAPSAEEAESERYMRLMAEFQNFKKRAAKEKTDIHAYANEKLMNELLPVLDNFERALEIKTGDGQGGDAQAEELKNYAQGMELIFQQMKTVLSNHGLKEIAALGEDFDPNMHSAVMTEESEEYESGKVSKVLQKGYELNGRVVRPAMVAVCK